MSLLLSDTICALATPPGVAGLAVVRVSGPQAIAFCASHFVASTPLAQSESRTVRVGWWQVGEDNVDEVTATVFRHPNSYTGEDVVEIGCHGGPFVVDQILESLYHDGARAALPGEFTRRAFVNKKIDLTQVEAVADIIHSQSTVGAQTAARQLAGGFTRQLSLLRSNLLDSAGLLEIELDFSEEGYEFVSRPRFVASLREGLSLTEALMKTARGAQILRSGYHVAIVGFPNAGKSSLFNALVGKQRAIVSAIAGTTRDYIEERVVLSGYTIHLYDTAGLRDTEDSIEMQGIRVTASLVEQSNLVLVVNDAHQGLDASQPLVSDLKDRFPHVQVTTVQNKCDTLSADPDAWSELVRNGDLTVSAVMPQTLNALESFLVQGVSSSADGIHDVLVNSRQLALLTTLHSHLLSAMNAVTTNQPADLIAIDVRHAIHVMGEITGETWNPDVLDSVFSRFCIGK